MISRALTQAAMTNAAIPWMTCFGLLCFFLFFVGMLFWIRREGSRVHYLTMSQLPLESEVQKNISRGAES